MTKKDLIEVVAKKSNLTNKAARDAVQTTLNTIRDSLKRGEKGSVNRLWDIQCSKSCSEGRKKSKNR